MAKTFAEMMSVYKNEKNVPADRQAAEMRRMAEDSKDFSKDMFCAVFDNEKDRLGASFDPSDIDNIIHNEYASFSREDVGIEPNVKAGLYEAYQEKYPEVPREWDFGGLFAEYEGMRDGSGARTGTLDDYRRGIGDRQDQAQALNGAHEREPENTNADIAGAMSGNGEHAQSSRADR